MQAEQQSEREAFEARVRKLSPCANLSRQKEVFGGHYRTTTIQRAWEQWQAAIEWQKQQARAALSHPSHAQPLESYALQLLVAAGHITQQKADEAMYLARETLAPPPVVQGDKT